MIIWLIGGAVAAAILAALVAGSLRRRRRKALGALHDAIRSGVRANAETISSQYDRGRVYEALSRE